MPITLRTMQLSVLALPLVLLGCGKNEAPTEASGMVLPKGKYGDSKDDVPYVAPAPEFAIAKGQSDQSDGPNDHVQHFDPAPEFPYANTQAATQRARMQAQGIPVPPPVSGDSGTRVIAEQVRDGVQQTSAEVTQGVDDLKSGVNQAVGDAQGQAKQAASAATDGVKGFATELQTDAQQSLNDAVGQVKGSVNESVKNAKANLQGAADSARTKFKRQAKAAGDSALKQAADLETKAVDGLLGPGTKQNN